MSKQRLEAFSDGVFAIVITIMVLEMKVPHGAAAEDLRPLGPVFVSYLLSFMFVGIYWNNHHHLFAAVEQVDGGILWRNLHLLFWLSQVPFAAGWVGENHFAALPLALYGFVLMMASFAYCLLVAALVDRHGRQSRFALALCRDARGKVSVALYGGSVALAMAGWRGAAIATQVLVAVLWFVPDRRVER